LEVPRAGFDPASPTRKASILSILKVSLTGLYVFYSILPGLILAVEIWLINPFLLLPIFALS